MKSGIHNIEIENGSTFEMDLALNNNDDTDFDISEYTVDMQMRDRASVLILDCKDYISINNINHITIDIPATATEDISEVSGVYQIEIYTGQKEYSVLRGAVTFIGAVIK